MLTGHSHGDGWIDVAVVGTTDIRVAIAEAERATGCLVSHGRGYIGDGFDPAVFIDVSTGEITRRHHRAARPVVDGGPPDVMRAIAQALRPPTGGKR